MTITDNVGLPSPPAASADRRRWELVAHNRAIDSAVDEIREHLRNLHAAQSACAELLAHGDPVLVRLAGAESTAHKLRGLVESLRRPDPTDDDMPF